MAAMPTSQLVSELLVRCLRVDPDDTLIQDLRDLADASWHDLLDDAMKHGVAPLLHHRLQTLKNVGLPPPVSERLRDLYLHNHLRNAAVLEQLDEIASAAAAHGARLIPLKGAHLAKWVYDEPALRPMLDLDLLVRPSDELLLRRALVQSGYEDIRHCDDIDYTKLHHLKPLSKRGGVRVEVHRALAPPDAPFIVDVAAIWARATTNHEGTGASLLAPDDVLLHLCAHTAYNDEFCVGLLAFCDIDATVRRYNDTLDWGRFVTTANADGRSRFAYAALHITHRLLDTAIPQPVLTALEHAATDEKVIDEATAYVLGPAEDVPTTVKLLDGAGSTTARLGTIARSIFPPPDGLRKTYRLRRGAKAVYLFYLYRPIELMWRRGREVLGILFGTRRAQPSIERERRRRMISRWAKEQSGSKSRAGSR